jgi:hypothetical protein
MVQCRSDLDADIQHVQFGDGIILSREKSGNDVRLVVTFSRVGRKTLIA